MGTHQTLIQEAPETGIWPTENTIPDTIVFAGTNHKTTYNNIL
jgi:hypothetical protein